MKNKLEKLLREEIKIIPRPFGIFLSGGIDSAILAALAKPDFAFTCNYQEGEKYDELEYAEMIAEYLDIELTIISPEAENFISELELATKIIGRPTNSVSIVPWYNLMKVARGRAMLCGEGADELFGGYSRYLIMKYVFELYDRPELKNYKPMLDFLFKDMHSRLVEKEMSFTTDMNKIMNEEFEKILPDILFMENELAKHFKVILFRPFMAWSIQGFAQKLSIDNKLKGWTTKCLLRKLASNYLPRKIYNRIDKKGLVCPVNKHGNWDYGAKGEFDKKKYLEYQENILKDYGKSSKKMS